MNREHSCKIWSKNSKRLLKNLQKMAGDYFFWCTLYSGNDVQSHASSSSTVPSMRPWRFSRPCDLDLYPFELQVNACWGPVTEYVFTKFRVDGLSRFSFRAWTHTHKCAHVDRHTDSHWSLYARIGHCRVR